jgi:hypothetical protein
MANIFNSGHPNLRSATRAIQFIFWNGYKASLHAQTAGPILRVALEKQWNERERAGIWSLAVCPLSISSKATVRRHHRRRLVDAFREALNERGLDEHGEAIDGQAPSLRGTLHLIARPSIIETDFPALRRECARILSQIIKSRPHAPQGLGSENRVPYSSNNRTRNYAAQTARPSKSHVAKAAQ